MTQYLNEKVKSEIVAAAIKKAGIEDKEKALVERRIAWAENVRIDALGGADAAAALEALMAQVKSMLEDIPDTLCRKDRIFRHEASIMLNVGGLQAAARFNGDTHHRILVNPVYKLSPARHTIHAGTPLALEFEAIENEARDLEDQRRTLENTIRGSLSGIRTVSRLLKEWPEAAALLPEWANSGSPNLPAIRRADLNNMIGLEETL